jgi:hypothetical protein
MVFTRGTIISMVGTGLGILGTFAGFIGGKISANEKEAREIDELDARNEERWNKWIADKSSKD